MSAHIKKSDKVIVLTGRDKGKTGEVLKVLPKQNRVIVSGVNIVTRHAKATARDAGGKKRT
jgi:large subunit ribosomal protein L24